MFRLSTHGELVQKQTEKAHPALCTGAQYGIERVITYLVIHDVNYSPVLDCISNLVQLLIHVHALGIRVVAEAQTDYALVFAEDGLIDVPG